jgi:gliding motility-associated-like protein
MKNSIALCLFFLFTSVLSAQETQWMFGLNGIFSGNSIISSDNEGNILIANTFVNSGTFQFKNASITTTNTPNSNTSNILLSKVTPDSSLIWTFATDIPTGKLLTPIDLTIDGEGSVYLLISYNAPSVGNFNFTSNLTLTYSRTGRRNAIIKFDKNGNPLWIREYGRTTLNPGDQVNHKIVHLNERVYISHIIRGEYEYQGSNQNITAIHDRSISIATYDTSGQFVWVKQLGSGSLFGNGRRDFKVGKNSLFVVAHLDIELIVNSDTIPTGHNIIKLDTSGSVIDHLNINYAKPDISSLSGIKIEVDSSSESVYVAFPFQDSIEVLSRKEYSKTNILSNYSFCLFKIKNQMKEIDWCRCQDSGSMGFFSPIAGLKLNNNNLYFGGQLAGDSVLFANNLFYTGISSNNFKVLISKIDTLGNLLWGFVDESNSLGMGISSLGVDTLGDLYISGLFVSRIKLFNDSLINNGIGERFLAKITDYSITRGEVFAGPYCAGDSILIPYTRMGPFDTANFFIAELSDENGNFEGGQRELGRLKTTEDSTIIGALPLFEVSSSANYRIRIRSTHPPVQSFFRRDSLRLLIYSRDKADPGPPETVCFGDSFRLNTFGGTAWEWSPAYRMDNPNARSPLIYPDRDTLFRIVISDSSGCGEPDTAFKQIFIRPKAQIQTQTLVNACWGLPVNLTANFTQGDSSQYRWTWFSTQNPTAWVPLQSDSFRTKDTFTFNYPQSNVNRRFALVLEDDCQTIKDTALITVRLSPHRISSFLSTQDSVICYQSQQNLIANISGGDSLTYQWQWFEVDAMGEFSLIKQDSIRFSDTLQVQLRPESKDFQRYALVSNDNCIPFFDTAYLNVNINPHQPQVGILPTDTAICPSTLVELVGQVNNGSALGYAFVWLDEANTILQTDTGFSPPIFVPTPDFSGGQSERMYRLIAQDLCSPNADTAQTRITPLEPLQAIPNTFDTTVCSGQELYLSASGLGGVGSNYQYQWILNNNIISSDSDVGFIPPINPSPFTIQLVLSDGCMPHNDTAEVIIRVRPALRSAMVREPHHDNEPHHDHAVQDTTVCSGSELRFFAKAFGGDSTNYSYEWLWNNSLMGTQKELLFVPIHPSPSTLHLISKDGCTVPNDTTSVTINILPPLNVSASLSGAGALPDTLCSGEETQLFAQAFGGDSTNYSFEWLLNDSLIATGSDVVVRLSNHHPSPSTLQLILSDGCSSPNDTFTHTFIIRPSLAIDLFASTLCANPTTTLSANPSGGNPDNYLIQWFDEAGNMIGEGLSIEVTPTRLSTYRASLSDGCSADTASAQIQIDLIPSILELTASPTQGCEPLPVDFEVNTNYSNTFIYTLLFTPSDSSQSLPPTNPPLSFTFSQGIYTPTLILTTQLGCDTTLTGPTITIHPKPTAAFSFSPEEPDLDNNSVQFRNLSTGANSYVWSISPFGNFTEAEPNVIYTDSGFHPLQLIAISNQDCRDTVQGQVYIRTNYRVYIPNVFSPNGDGKNDLFRPAMRGFAESDLNIYNRWGERLFQSRDNTGWDGTYRGQPVPKGVYMYTLSVLNLYGEKQFFNGTVVLMR